MGEDGKRVSTDGAVLVAQLNLVDLAGSERADQTGTYVGPSDVP